jgi:hypothetical protein
MVEKMGTRIPSQMEGQKGQRIYRKRNLDNYCRACHDLTDRGLAQCTGQSFQPDYQQPQLDPLDHGVHVKNIRGSSFIELLLVLPVFLTLVWGSLGIFLWAQESYAAGQVAQIGVSAWASTDSVETAQGDVSETLEADGYSPQTVRTEYIRHGSLDRVTVSLPFQAVFWGKHPEISASRSAMQGTGTDGSGTQRWW